MKYTAQTTFRLSLAALLLSAASAQAQTYSPSQTGAVGSIVTATDPNGRARQVVEPHFICDIGCSGSGNSGVGSMAAVPAGSTNGTALGTLPGNAVGVRFYLASTDSVTFTVASSQPSSAPSQTFTISGSATGPNWDENLSSGEMVYVTATSGSPKFRWW